LRLERAKSVRGEPETEGVTRPDTTNPTPENKSKKRRRFLKRRRESGVEGRRKRGGGVF